MEHLTEVEIKAYGSHALATSALLKVDRHLAECSACRYELRRAVTAPRIPALVADLSEPIHLSYKEMVDYVDGSVDEAARQRMEEHGSICLSCANELKTLQVFDAQMTMELNLASAAEVSEVPGWFSKMSENIAQFFATPQRLRFAGAGAGLMALGVVSLAQAHVEGSAAQRGSLAMAHLSLLSSVSQPHLFYGGFVVAGAGAVAILYGLFKK
jgi:anti-sigma factor RsiW